MAAGIEIPRADEDSIVVTLGSSVGSIRIDQSLFANGNDKDDSDKKGNSSSATPTTIVVGRTAAAQLRVSHASVGRKHASMYYQRGAKEDQGNETNNYALMIQDLGSKYGTTVNGQKLASNATLQLQEGDQITFGKVKDCVFTVRYPKEITTTKESPAKEMTEKNNETTTTTGDQQQQQQEEEETVEPKGSSQTALQDAGAGLEGRAKRQAEIDAMVASLKDKPTYQVVAVEQTMPPTKQQQQQPLQDDTNDEDALVKLAKRHKLPMTRRLDLPAETTSRGNELLCLALESSGARFCLGGRDTHMRMYDFGGLQHANLGPFVDWIPEDGNIIVDAAFGGRQQLLVATGSVQPQVFNRDGQKIVQFVRGDSYVSDPMRTKGHTAPVTGVDWHPRDPNVALTGSMDGSARLWHMNGATSFQMLMCHKVFVVKSQKAQKTPVTAVCYAPGSSSNEFAVGTACGSLQVWNPAKPRAMRTAWAAHSGEVRGLHYSADGRFLVSRCADDTTVHVWQSTRLQKPLVSCGGLPTIYERSNAVLSPDGTFLVAGSAKAIEDEGPTTQSGPPKILGHLHIFRVDVETRDPAADPVVLEPILSVAVDVPPTFVAWHAKLNQLFVAGADGSASVWYSPKLSEKGACMVKRAGRRPTDAVTQLLRDKAPTGSAAYVGEIITPLEDERLMHLARKKKRSAPETSTMPERPAAKKLLGSQSGGTTTFQQFVADQQQVGRLEQDPREALLKYHTADGDTKGGSKLFSDGRNQQPTILAAKTAEQEAEESKK